MFSSRIKKLILARLLFGVIFLYLPAIFKDTPDLVFYAVSCLICFLSFIYLIWFLTGRRLHFLAWIQMVGDVLLETYLVFFTGGVDSIFSTLYVLTILSSALLLGERRTVLQVTTLSSVAYLIASCGAHQKQAGVYLLGDPVYFLYGSLVRVTIFFMVGSLSRYLSGTILELQQRLKLSERLSLLGEAASKIAHEVRNPLSSMRMAAEVLQTSLAGKLSAEDSKMVSIVETEAERLTQTLQRILDYAKKAPPNRRKLLLDPLIERILSLVRLRPQFQNHGITVQKKYPPAVQIYADEEQILGALLNLVLNAYQAMAEGGTFKIEAWEDLHGTTLILEDTGGGIPQDKLKDIFLPFKSNKQGGTGLGLAEVHKIVTLHEGKIEVESDEGKSTRFKLFFPKP